MDKSQCTPPLAQSHLGWDPAQPMTLNKISGRIRTTKCIQNNLPSQRECSVLAHADRMVLKVHWVLM